MCSITMYNCRHFLVTVILVFSKFSFLNGLNYTIQEEQGSDVLLGNVATDADLRSLVLDEEDFKTLRYSFLTQGYEYTSYFKIDDKTGDLKTAKNINREEICEFLNECDISLEVAAQSSISVFFKKIKINVHVIDINDNQPTFSSSILHLSISEASQVGSEYNIEGAVDRDSLNYSVKSYRIDPPESPFEAKFLRNLDGSSVVKLSISKSLNREKYDNYQIQLIAEDGGNKSGSLMLNITVTDVNDNAPVFSKSSYNVTVQEDIALNTTILVVSASDTDMGKNGEVMYRISPNQPDSVQKLFSINAISGKLKVIGNLVYEPNKPYKIIVEAIDKGDQPRVSQAYVYVNILDSENNPPVIKVNLLSETNMSKISEYANMGAVVAHVAVEDADTGRNGLVTCSITSGYFQLQRLDVNEYKVIVQNPLDRELIPEHYVSIFCRDVGSPPLDSRTSFKVEVLDENDHSPKFTADLYNASITENNNLDAVIIQVHATDLDSGNNSRITYHLHSDAGSIFSINRETGIIKANRVFDREITPQYKFRVAAVDGGAEPRSSTAVVVLSIGDQNDNKPQFTQTAFRATVLENLPIGTNVTKVFATDRDFDLNGVVTFSMKKDSNIPFTIHPNGTIRTTDKLDRENISQYIFTVMATDHGNPSLSNSVDVTVLVGDANDNSPVITYPNASNDTITISYNMRLNSIIATINAHDIDEGENKNLIYYIKSRNDSDFFNLNSRTGEIIIAKQLQEQNMNKYFLEIAVSDQGSPRQTSIAKFYIVVALRNVTAVTEYPPLEQPYNIAIVVTVVVVTVVLSASILVTIFIIRRLDQRKKQYGGSVIANGNKGPNQQVAQYIITDGKGSTYSAPGERIGGFCSYAPEPTLDKISVSSQNTTIQVSLSNGNIKSASTSRETVTGNQSFRADSPDVRQSELHRLASLRLQQTLLQSHDKQSSNHHLQPQNNGEVKRTSDNHSDTSGETIDSGKGASETDGHNSFSNSHLSEDFHKYRLTVDQGGRRGTPPHKNYPQTHLYPQLNTPRSSVSHLSNSGGLSPRGHPESSYHSNHPIHNQRYPKNSISSSTSDFPPSYGHFQQGLHLPAMDETCDSIVTGYDDDDNTTTSGSYTIDAEEYPVELRLDKIQDVFV